MSHCASAIPHITALRHLRDTVLMDLDARKRTERASPTVRPRADPQSHRRVQKKECYETRQPPPRGTTGRPREGASGGPPTARNEGSGKSPTLIRQLRAGWLRQGLCPCTPGYLRTEDVSRKCRTHRPNRRQSLGSKDLAAMALDQQACRQCQHMTKYKDEENLMQ